MINIEYTLEALFGEPGPNFYWKGKCKDYLRLMNDLYVLAKENGHSLFLNDFSYINMRSGHKVLLKSSENGIINNSIQNETILIDLDKQYWKKILIYFLILSLSKSHEYIDFDGKNLIENANWIISSEG